MTIGSKIRTLREEKGLSQEELAQKMGYKSKTSIHKIEQDVTDLPLSKVNEFAKILGTSPAYLMGWEEEVSNINDVKSENLEIASIMNRDGKITDIMSEISENFSDEDKEKTLDFIKFLKIKKKGNQ